MIQESPSLERKDDLIHINLYRMNADMGPLLTRMAKEGREPIVQAFIDPVTGEILAFDDGHSIPIYIKHRGVAGTFEVLLDEKKNPLSVKRFESSEPLSAEARAVVEDSIRQWNNYPITRSGEEIE